MSKYNFSAQITFFVFLFLAIFATSVIAIVNVPNFPSCVNPQGTVIASYSSGTHGVPGDSTAYSGSDTVYKINNETLTQCLCTDDGDGIQTNWWKASSLSSQEIENLKTQDWVFVPDGTAWGLDNTSYLSKNSKYSCRGIGGGGDVLGLATTGDIKIIYSLLLIGTASLCLGFVLNRKGS